MDWRFWKNKKKSGIEKTLESLKEEVSQITRRFNMVEEYLQGFEQKIEVTNQHLQDNENMA
ncbi:MAG TPA: hypothetical protein VFD17_02750, partial [Clostridia bacterium]|nr:hypothetical protein [Clostridia bacterium]